MQLLRLRIYLSVNSPYAYLIVNRHLYILVATPLGKGGKGGIDRIMDELRTVLEQYPPVDFSIEFCATRGPNSIFLSPFYLIGFIGRMIYLRIRRRVDLLHINLASYGSTWRKLFLARVASLLGVPYIIHLHGGLYRDFWQKAPRIIQREIRSLFSRAAHIIVLGTVWRDFIADCAPETRDRIEILPNATRRSSLPHRTGGETVVILFLGRVCERKGAPQLMDALNCLKSLSAWRAVIAGDGDLATARTRIYELGLDRRVQMPGWVGPGEVQSLIADADILVLPSFHENLPMSVIEGMAAGLAIVATPVGAVEDIITDDQTGLLVPPGDVAALADALRRLIENPTLRQRLGTAAAAYHAQYLEIGCYANKLTVLWRDAIR